jgi:hypothetical protein
MAREPRWAWRDMLRGAMTPAAETSAEGWATAARLQSTLLVRAAHWPRDAPGLRRFGLASRVVTHRALFGRRARAQADSPDEVRDLLTAMVLSECVYKVRRRPRLAPRARHAVQC